MAAVLAERQEAEAKAHEWESVFNKASWAVAVVDPFDDTLKTVNPAFAAMHGFTVEELVGRPLADVCAPESHEDLVTHIQTAHQRADYVYELVHVRRDGTRFLCLSHVTTLKEAHGKIQLRAATFEDITNRKQAEGALRASEERFAKAFRTSPHPIGITEVATGRCIEVNDACLQLFGFDREEVIGNTTLMLGIWPNQEDRARLVEQLQAGRPVHNLELSFKTKMGDVRHILVSSDVAELNGTFCLVTVGNDITERKMAEAKLQESEERLRLAQSAANIGTFDWNIAAQTVVWSPETERIWGLSVGQFGGTYEHWRRQVHPDDAAEVERIVRLSLENPDIPYAYEHRIIRPDGTVRWIHANTTTRRDTAGRPIRMVGVNFDITARKQAEAKLRESEARFRNVFEHAGIGIAIANLYGGSVRCNPAYCAMLGYSEDELRNLDFSQIVHFEDRDVNQAEIKRLLTEELPYFEIENRYVHKNGEPVWVHKFVSLLRD
ncbi:MAG TPA: PAS domain S-box protein, partial [Nitrospira sp.]|nr:PAS domain S-box protein [Nitrospira sp.]